MRVRPAYPRQQGHDDPSTGCGGGPCDVPTLGVLQRRRDPTTGIWAWANRDVEEDSLQDPRFAGLDWTGGTTSQAHVDYLWAATSGGGVLDGLVSW
jgi:hypothetical protein